VTGPQAHNGITANQGRLPQGLSWSIEFYPLKIG